MAVRDAAAIVADGDQLDDGYFNDLVIRRQVETPSNQSHTGDTTLTETTSFTLDAALNAFLIGIKIKGTLDNNGGASVFGRLRFRLTGSNLGTVYVAVNEGGAGDPSTPRIGFADTNTTFGSRETSQVLEFSNNPMLKILDATTTFRIDLQTSNGANTVTFNSITIQFIWVNSFVGD